MPGIAVAGAAAGTGGASYRRILTYPSKAAGLYVLNETNFAGLGQYLPCFAVVTVGAGTAGTAIEVSYDNGTTWLNMVSGATPFGALLYLDTANTFRINVVTTAANIRIFVQ